MHILQRAVIAISGAALFTYSYGESVGGHIGLPTVGHPANNPPTAEKVTLGGKIFFDNRLSASGKISCASCHQPDRAFSDGLSISRGVDNLVGTRNAPSLLNAGVMETQFWDGRRTTLEAQALDPFVNPREHGLPNTARLVALVRADPSYPALFAQAFGITQASIDEDSIAKALASYVRSLNGGASAFDYYYYGGEQTALSQSARRGLTLFLGRAQCATCHQIGPSSASFSDQKFHGLHIGMSRIETRLADITKHAVAARHGKQSADATVLSDTDISELGRFFVTLDPADIGQFRTPSLRNVALTAPYMHDGSIDTLAQAVDQEIYYRSNQNGRPIVLTPEEKTDLVHFLESLTGETAQRATLH